MKEQHHPREREEKGLEDNNLTLESLFLTFYNPGDAMLIAGVVELVDTQVSDACGGNPVEVQVLSSANNSSMPSKLS